MSGILGALASGVRVFELGQPLHATIPCSPNHPGFKLSLTRRHGDMVRPDGSSAASEMIVTGGHVGTHVDALSHVSHDGLLHGGIDAAEAQRGGRFRHHGVDQLGSVITRGVLLDVPRALGRETLEPGHAIAAGELEAAVRHAGVRPPGEGDAVLVRTGWARLWDDPVAFVGHSSGVPGPDEAAARWLSDRRIRLTGSDTTAYEHIPPNAGHRLLPVHRLLLVERGIPIVEMLDLERLAEAGMHEFAFVLAPLRIVGGTGSPVQPLALVDADG